MDASPRLFFTEFKDQVYAFVSLKIMDGDFVVGDHAVIVTPTTEGDAKVELLEREHFEARLINGWPELLEKMNALFEKGIVPIAAICGARVFLRKAKRSLMRMN